MQRNLARDGLDNRGQGFGGGRGGGNFGGGGLGGNN